MTASVLLGQTGQLPWWGYALLMVAIVLVLVLPRKLARRSRILPATRLSESDRLRHSMDKLLLELQEVAREVNATIDTKMVVLNQLIEEADRKIAELKKLQSAQTPSDKLTAPSMVGEPAGPALPPSPQPIRRPAPPMTPEEIKRRQTEAEVFRLAAEGKTRLEIAQMTGMPRGEVELVLALRRPAARPDGGGC